MKKHARIVICLAFACAACQPAEEQMPDHPEERTWALTVRAARDVTTKGLSIGDGESEAATMSLLSVWKEGEQVSVRMNSTFIGTLTATPDPADAHYATLSGEVIASGITPGVTRLFLQTPRQEWDYTGQTGQLLSTGETDASIERNYNYIQASNVLVTKVNGSVITTEDASFKNQQSIYRFSFRFQKGGVGDKTPINARQLTISAAGGGLWRNEEKGTGPITVTLGTPTADPFFVALRNQNTTSEEVLNFQVVDSDGITYIGSKSIPAGYKPNGTFVSAKNATLTSRLGVTIHDHSDTVTGIL